VTVNVQVDMIAVVMAEVVGTKTDDVTMEVQAAAVVTAIVVATTTVAVAV